MKKLKLKKINVVILGSKGYTGTELTRILSKHPYVRICKLGSDRSLTKRTKSASDKLSPIDHVFCCLPDGEAQKFSIQHCGKVSIVDLSGDFRIKNPALHKAHYKKDHKASQLLPLAVYGLSELYKQEIKNATLVANPGCYPTSILLAITPLIGSSLINPKKIIVDAKSGFSGAGRRSAQKLLQQKAKNFYPYSAVYHKHVPEIEQCVKEATKKDSAITFVPHLIPVERGILSTIYVTLRRGVSTGALRGKLKSVYGKEKFVKILKPGILPSTGNVNHTNLCLIAVLDGKKKGEAIIVSAIDNLVKGASGQAVQNMNLMYGFPEDTALNLSLIHI